MDYSSKFNSLLYDLKRDGRYRRFIDLERQVGALPTAIWRQLDGTERLVTVWCNNDYLGMGQPLVDEVAIWLHPARID